MIAFDGSWLARGGRGPRLKAEALGVLSKRHLWWLKFCRVSPSNGRTGFLISQPCHQEPPFRRDLSLCAELWFKFWYRVGVIEPRETKGGYPDGLDGRMWTHYALARKSWLKWVWSGLVAHADLCFFFFFLAVQGLFFDFCSYFLDHAFAIPHSAVWKMTSTDYGN